MKKIILSLMILSAASVFARDYDRLITYFSERQIKEVAEEISWERKPRSFFDLEQLETGIYLPENDLAEFFKYLFWAFDKQRYWIKFYPFKQLDLENDEPTCSMLIFEMSF